LVVEVVVVVMYEFSMGRVDNSVRFGGEDRGFEMQIGGGGELVGGGELDVELERVDVVDDVEDVIVVGVGDGNSQSAVFGW
jgi:hypothetical protein